MKHEQSQQTSSGSRHLPTMGTLERWAFDYLVTDELDHKLMPMPVPGARCAQRHAQCTLRPGRPGELRLTWDKYKAPRSAHALSDARKRAHLLHTFFHHELQAAELMCWAV